MAGSYGHIVSKKGRKFLGTSLLDNMGDAYEALEECYLMIEELSGGDQAKIDAARAGALARLRKDDDSYLAPEVKEP